MIKKHFRLNKAATDLFLFAALLFVRIYKLEDIPLHDYDAVRNFQIAQGIAASDFTLMNTHGSPVFHLFNAFLYWISGEIFPILVFGTICNVLAVFVLGKCFSFLLRNEFSESNQNLIYVLFMLICGFSPLLVYLSRCITNENLNFLFFSFLFWAYVFRQDDFVKALFFALCFAVNYKVLLILPFLEFSFFENLSISSRRTAKFFVVLMLFCGFFSLFSFALGIGGDNYAKNVAGIFLNKTKAAHSPILNLDLTFYLRYIYEIELSPHFFLLFLFYLFGKQTNKTAWLFFAFFLLLHLLPKAPRALLYFLPMLYYVGLSAFFKILLLLKSVRLRKFFLFFCFLSLLILPFNLERLIWQYAQKENFSFVQSILREKNIAEIYSLNSLQIAPYISQKVIPVRKGHNFKRGDVVFYDSYHVALNEFFNVNLKDCEILYFAEQKLYDSPFLYYEHSEYSGLSYDKISQIRKRENLRKWFILKTK